MEAKESLFANLTKLLAEREKGKLPTVEIATDDLRCLLGQYTAPEKDSKIASCKEQLRIVQNHLRVTNQVLCKAMELNDAAAELDLREILQSLVIDEESLLLEMEHLESVGEELSDDASFPGNLITKLRSKAILDPASCVPFPLRLDQILAQSVLSLWIDQHLSSCSKKVFWDSVESKDYDTGLLAAVWNEAITSLLAHIADNETDLTLVEE